MAVIDTLPVGAGHARDSIGWGAMESGLIG